VSDEPGRRPAPLEDEASELPAVYLVGPGALGLSLGRALLAAGVPLAAVAWHSEEGRARAERWLPGVPLEPVSAPRRLGAAALVVLAVRDDVVGKAAAALAPHRREGQVVVHTSGLLTAGVLREAGLAAPVGSFHPLQAFASPARGPELLASCVVAVEGDAAAVEAGRALAATLGAEVVTLSPDPDAKVAYHAAAVVASNYLVTLAGLATRLAALAGLDEASALRMLLPLQRGTLENLGALGVSAALTGPVVRGDAATVRAHLALLEARCPELRTVYCVLGRQAAELARVRGADAARLADVLAALQE
jgi:predicted short-subunit dehydrogenase-like oxidoreductase (DUF2520 family)